MYRSSSYSGLVRAFILPTANAAEAALISEAVIYPARTLLEVYSHLAASQPEAKLARYKNAVLFTPCSTSDFSEVKGQAQAKRAMETAAAGGHSVLMVGPPGTGKSMLATRLPSILPPMGEAEALESAAVQSLTGSFSLARWRQRPFRSPHHTASGVALVGGGSIPRPGEISLANHGVLFLDELPEFDKKVLEVLREPLETGRITISRAARQAEFPCQFQLIAAMNPCPCGYYGDTIQGCTCSPRQREQYWAKLSGPLMDRIDLQVAVNRLKPEEITQQPTGEASKSVAERVRKARELAMIRFQKEEDLQCNAQMQSRHLQKWCNLDDASRTLLEAAIRKLGLSARASDRILKVARTIADLAADENLKPQHVAEAIQYRTIDRMQ
jgi:magnesium chelatase family protein